MKIEAISDESNKRNPTKASSATHSDLSKSSVRKNIALFSVYRAVVLVFKRYS